MCVTTNCCCAAARPLGSSSASTSVLAVESGHGRLAATTPPAPPLAPVAPAVPVAPAAPIVPAAPVAPAAPLVPAPLVPAPPVVPAKPSPPAVPPPPFVPPHAPTRSAAASIHDHRRCAFLGASSSVVMSWREPKHRNEVAAHLIWRDVRAVPARRWIGERGEARRRRVAVVGVRAGEHDGRVPHARGRRIPHDEARRERVATNGEIGRAHV